MKATWVMAGKTSVFTMILKKSVNRHFVWEPISWLLHLPVIDEPLFIFILPYWQTPFPVPYPQLA
jgi:hypothetical protein